jgi:hypothetical protein
MTASRVLFWHRRDLRLADNLGIQAAVEISPAVTGVYVLDPALIHPPQSLPPMAPARLWFLLESLIELQQRWRAAGSRLLILEGDPGASAAAVGRTALRRGCGLEQGCRSPTAANGIGRWRSGCRLMVERWWWIGISC